MKTRAAIAARPNKPLVIKEVDLEGPKAGEVPVEIKATGVWRKRGISDSAYFTQRKNSGVTKSRPRGLFRGKRIVLMRA